MKAKMFKQAYANNLSPLPECLMRKDILSAWRILTLSSVVNPKLLIKSEWRPKRKGTTNKKELLQRQCSVTAL